MCSGVFEDFRVKSLLAILLLALLLLNAWLWLPRHSFAEHDEARHVASALEMRHSGELVVTTYMGQPDYWNAKPPLSIWAVAAAYPLLDDKLVSTRLPALVATLLTCLLIFFYARGLSGFYAGLLAVALFVTARKYVAYHGLRTADADALFIFFVAAAGLALSRMTRPGVYAAFFLLGLAFLTKSFHVLLYLAAMGIFVLGLCWYRRLPWSVLPVLVLCFLLPVLSWACLRWQEDGGRFFAVMVSYDLLRRTSMPVEGHSHSAIYYGVVLLETLWPALIAIAILASCHLRLRTQLLRDPRQVLLLLWVLLPLLGYSCARSRCSWYIFPVLPALCVMAAAWLFDAHGRWPWPPRRALLLAMLLALCLQEVRLLQRLARYPQPAVVLALEQVSRQYPRQAVAVSLEGPWRQHYYAMAMVLGLEPVLPAASPKPGRPHVLVTASGQWRPLPGAGRSP